jgi:hypothetical protein
MVFDLVVLDVMVVADLGEQRMVEHLVELDVLERHVLELGRVEFDELELDLVEFDELELDHVELRRKR